MRWLPKELERLKNRSQLPTCTTAPNWIGESSEDSPTRGASVVVAARDSEVVVVVSVGVAGAASPNVV